MIYLNLSDLNKIKEIVEEMNLVSFTLSQENESGIGNILSMSYDTFVADYPAKMTIEISGVENW